MNNEEIKKIGDDYVKHLEQLQDIFVEKNELYDYAFFTQNDDISEAFVDIERRMEILRIAIKYRQHSFDRERFKRDLFHLANYAIMTIIFIDRMPVVRK